MSSTILKLSPNESSQGIAIKVQQNVQMQCQNILQEYILLKTFQHPNIITTWDYYENFPLLNQYASPNVTVQAFTMELASSDLRQHLAVNKAPMEPSMARQIFSGIASALLFLHKNNIYHNDIKLENILLFNDGSSKLADFGFASTKNSPYEQGNWSQRNPALMAPEIHSLIASGSNVELSTDLSKSDVFAFGITLFECILRILPFETMSSNESDPYYQYILNKDYNAFWRLKTVNHLINIYKKRFPDDFRSDQFQDLINKLIAANPSERISFEEILLHPWLQSQTKFDEEVEEEEEEIDTFHL